MIRRVTPSLVAWLAAVAGSFVIFLSSLGYLGNVARDVATGEAGAAEAAGTSGRRQPSYIATIEPLPPGSINAISPLGAAPPAGSPEPGPAAEVVAVAATPEAAPMAPEAAATEPEPAVQAAAVAEAEPASAPAAAAGRRLVMATSAVNVRDRPSNSSRVIGTVRGGARLAVIGEHQGWLQVSGEGRSGWIYGRFLRPAN